MGRTRKLGHGVRAALLLLIALLLGVALPTIASAAPGDAVPTLPGKTVTPASATGGQTVQYTVNYTCSNNEADVPPDGCDGAEFADAVPQFTNVYGESMPLEFVSASGPASVWPDGFTLDDSDPANPVVRATAGSWPPGASGSIFITLRVPVGMVPEGTQPVTNQATVTDPDSGATNSSPEAASTVSGTAPSWTVSKLGPGTGTRMNRDYQWIVSVCGPAESALWPVYTITDTLPAGFQFTSAERGGTFVDDGATPGISDGAATVTWTFDSTNRAPLGSDGCFRFTVTGRFPSGYEHPDPVDPADEDNVGGAVKTNVVTGLGRTSPTDPGVGLGTAPWETTLTGPVFGSAGTDKQFHDLQGRDNFYATTGEEGRFELSGTVDSDFLLDSVTLTDGAWQFDDGSNPASNGIGLPQSFTATSLDPGDWNDPVAATIEGSNDGFATSTVIATGVASGDSDIALGTTYRSFRWTWSAPGSIRGDFQATGLAIIGDLGTPFSTFGLYTNTSTLSVVPDGAAPVQVQSSDQYVLETPLPLPTVTKSVANSTRQPGQTTTYSLRVTNAVDATGDLVDPVVSDCIPEHLVLQGTPTAAAPWAVGPSTTCASGQTPLSYVWQGTLEPGQQTTPISYTVQVAPSDPGPVAPYGTYSNTAFVSPSGGGSFAHCTNVQPSCGATATMTVVPTVELTSQKCVTGELDGGVFRPTPRCTSGEPDVTPALTTPGGQITYRLDLNNTGNTDADGVDFIDTFPRVGDTAVISGNGGALNPRRSEYAPILVTPITPPAGWTVAYSTSANPCRPEVGGPSSACETPNWTTTPDPLALSAYRSVKLSHPDVLSRGETASFEWTMRAPVLDDSYDTGGTDPVDPYERLHECEALVPSSDADHCPRAVNSFAYGADAANLPLGTPQPARLYAEPPQVEVRVVAPQFANSVGNRVWFDRNYDGLQDTDTSPTGEPGVPGIYVQLVSAGGTVLAETFTDAEGAYLFDTIDGAPIPDGDYVVRFFPPDGWYLSPPDVVGAGADEDSDVPRVPSGTALGLGPYHETPVVTLGDDLNVDLDGDGTPDGEADPTWDAGLWRAAPAVDIDKTTRDSAWPTSEAGDGVTILEGRPVTWTYLVTNTGNTRLEDVTIGDDGGDGPSFTVTDCTIVDDGANADGLSSSVAAPMALNRGAVVRCEATGVAGSDDYVNEGSVTGTPVLDDGTPVTDVPPGYPALTPVTDSDPSSYLAGAYDLALSKVPGVIDLATGIVTFTVTVENQGTVDSGDYTVTDELPAGMSLVSAIPEVTTDSGSTLTWELEGLAPGVSRELTIEAHVDDYLEGPFRNHAEISADGAASVQTGGVTTPTTDVDSTPETDPTNVADVYYGPIGDSTAADNDGIAGAGIGADTEDDEDIADLVPGVVYDLALAKTADATALTQDDDATIEYTITVANQGNVPSGAYVVTDTLAPGLTPVTPIAGGGVVGGGSGDPVTVTWTGTNLAPGAQATFVVDVVVSDLDARPYRNVAEISADSAQTLYGVDDVDSTPDADPTNDNAGNGVLTGDGYGPVGSPASGGVDNIDVSDAGNGNDGEDDADIADVALPLVGGYDLALAKTVDAPTVAYDGTITYTVAVQNQGVLHSREFEVTDHVPAGLVVVDDDGAVDGGDGTLTWTVDDLAPGATTTFTFTARVDDITQRPFRNYAEISADSADSYSVDGDVIADVDSTPDTDTGNDGTYGAVGSAGPVDNVGDGALLQAGVGSDPEDDADIADVVLPVTYDLALVKTGLEVIAADGTATFVVTVANQGNVPSGLFTVVDSVPEGMAATEASTGGVISGSGDEVVWADLESLLPGDTVELTVTTTITDVTQRPFTNVAEITEDSADSYSTETETVTDVDSTPGDVVTSDSDSLELADAGLGEDKGFDDEDIAVLGAEVVYDLALTKIVDRSTIAYDGTATFTVIVANQGNVASGATTVVDTVPLGLVADQAGGGGVISDDGRTVTWVVDLAVGEVLDLTVVVHVDDITQRPFLNSAEITEDGADGYSLPGDTVTDVDSVPGDEETSPVDTTDLDQAGIGDDAGYDDEDVALLDVPVVYDLALTKRLLPEQRFAAGDVVRYEVEVTNEGNVPSGAFSVSDTLPEGMAAVSASNAGALDGRMVVWKDLPSLDPGATLVLTVEARLDDVSRDAYVNRAQVTADSADTYSTPDEVVTDRDSKPGEVRGEDDEGSAEIPLGRVAADNRQAVDDADRGSRGTLPFTGGSFGGLLLLGLFAIGAGGALVLWVRRIRHTA